MAEKQSRGATLQSDIEVQSKVGRETPDADVFSKEYRKFKVTISNKYLKKEVKYGKRFIEMLDPRDFVMQEYFHFILVFDIRKMVRENYVFRESYQYRQFLS